MAHTTARDEDVLRLLSGGEMEVLGLFANQAAIALDLLQRARLARAALEGQGDLSVVARVAESLERSREDEDGSREPALRLLVELEKLL